MVARWIALVVFLATISIVGIFVSAVVRPPASNSGANGLVPSPSQLAGRAGSWLVSAEIAVGPADTMAIALSVVDAEGRPAAAQPTAVLRMVDMAAGVQLVPLAYDAPGRWRGSGRLFMSGRWSLQVDVDNASVSLPFDVTSP